MTCKQLGGVCNKEFHAKTFEEMAKMSKMHGMEMYQKGDEDHIKAMKRMMELMSDTSAMKKWMKNKQKEFNDVPADK